MSHVTKYEIKDFIQDLNESLSKLKETNNELFPFLAVSMGDVVHMSRMGFNIKEEDVIYLSNGQVLGMKTYESCVDIKAFEDKETPYRGRVSQVIGELD